MTGPAKVSVIIPALNEAAALPHALDHLQKLSPKVDEVIVVDAGSKDETVAIAESFGCKVVHSPKQGRATQLDLGARQAAGDMLIFLHADTYLPNDVVNCVVRTLSNPRNCLGAFISIMKGRKLRLWFSFLNYIKTYICPLYYRPGALLKGRLLLLFGDQVMFCRKADYLAVGGFDTEMQVMEEGDLCIRMSRLGRTKMIHRFVYSSDRRVSEWGFWKANRIYWYITFGWILGLSNQKMAELYTDIR